MHLHLQAATFAYTDAAPLLNDVSITLSPGWSGLVGPNGAGKTTLLRLLGGELSPARGCVRRAPQDLRVVLCAQELPEPTGELHAFAGSQQRAARRLRAALHLQAFERWSTLSPGERKRWQIGSALCCEPEVLLLDEPQNHLDRGARAWLIEALALYRGIGVIVSHDRRLLDRVTSHTLRLHDAALASYAGGYSQARREWELAAQQARADRSAVRARVRVLEQRAERARSAQRAAAANKSAGKRMKDRHDSDARSILARNKADWAQAAHGRKAELLGRELGRVQRELASKRADKPLAGRVFAAFSPAPSACIGYVAPGVLAAGGQPLLQLPGLTLQRDDRVWIAGPNGAGKSSLLRLLAGQLRLSQPDVLRLPQELSPPEAQGLSEQLRALDRAARGRVLNIVAALGAAPDRWLLGQLSPGEARKLMLALGFARQARALVLDEPENHLDLPALERLQGALIEYPGALYLVTHDEALARRCTSQRWSIERVQPVGGVLRVASLPAQAD